MSPDIPSSNACLPCCLGIDALSEDERWRLLYAVNSNLTDSFTPNLCAALGKRITFIRFASADHVPTDAHCADLSYPRICQLSLDRLSNGGNIDTPFLFSMGLDSLAQTLSYRMSYLSGDDWFAVAFGEAGMVGEAHIYTSGLTGFDPLSVYAYQLTDTRASNVEKDASNDLELLSTAHVDGLFTVRWTRPFETGDAGDDVYDGAEQSVRIFAAAARTLSAGTTQLGNHGAGHYVRALEVLLVPSPADSDVFWCDDASVVGDCILALEVPTTTTPVTTTAPSSAPTLGQCGGELYGSSGSFKVSLEIDCEDNTVTATIEYASYYENWWGVVFSDRMKGSALVYSTGKEGESYAQGLFPYLLNGLSESVVIRDENNEWTEISTTHENDTIALTYQQDLSATNFSRQTSSVEARAAWGLSLTLEYHGSLRHTSLFMLNRDRDDTPSPVEIMSSTTTTSSHPVDTGTGDKGCDMHDLVAATGRFDNLLVDFYLNCEDETVTVTLHYDEYADNWFGVVFSENMLGDALIWTQGKDNNRSAALYTYSISSRTPDGVVYKADANWNEISVVNVEGSLTVIYQQTLTSTPFTRETEEVSIRAAWSNSLRLQNHGFSGRSDSTITLSLVTGASDIQVDDDTLILAHGVVMWFAWAVFASIGIMSSAFRWLLPTGSLWFKIHKTLQVAVVVMDIVGFVLAILYTMNKGRAHFDDTHMILGLVVTILTVLQPINACVRPHPPTKNGWANDKPLARKVWEVAHKGLGYGTWIMACVTITLGLLLLDKALLAYVHAFVWCGGMWLAYVIASVLGLLIKRQDEQVKAVKKAMEQDVGMQEEAAQAVFEPRPFPTILRRPTPGPPPKPAPPPRTALENLREPPPPPTNAQECQQCGTTASGKVDENDGRFYCDACWEEYDALVLFSNIIS